MRLALTAIALASMLATAAAQVNDAGPPATVDAPYRLGEPEVRAAASPTELRLGASFTLFVTVVHDPDVQVNLPAQLELGAAFEEHRRVQEDRKRADGTAVREWQIEVLAWDLGDLMIPPIGVVWVARGKAAVTETRPVPIRVLGVLDDAETTQPRGLAPPVPLTSRTLSNNELAAAVVVVVVVIALITIAITSRRRTPSVAVALVLAPRRRSLGPHAEAALRALDAIEASGAIADAPHGAYRDMAEVVRSFLGNQHGFAAGELGPDELRARLVEVGLAPPASAAVGHWLDEADLVKYANHAPSTAEATGALAAARALVELVATSRRSAQLAIPEAASA